MSYNDISAITDPLEAIKALFAELTTVKEELSASKSDVASLKRNSTRQNVTIKRITQERDQFKKEAEALRSELEKLGGKYVEKDSSNSDTPPTKQSIKKQIVQRTRSLRQPSGKKPGGQDGHEGHSISKTQTPDGTEEHEEVPHHNNSSEASIRVLKVKGKVSGGFRTHEGAEEFACFHSIAETAKRNKISKFTALYQLISDMASKNNFFDDLISKES